MTMGRARWVGCLGLLWIFAATLSMSGVARGSEAAPAPQRPAAQAPAKATAQAPAKAAAQAPAKATAQAPAKATAQAPAPATAQGATDADKYDIDVSKRRSEVYGEQLDGLKADVESLKDRIFRSKARLALLKETVLKGVLAGSRVVLVHRNRMGSQFQLVRLVISLDGAQIYARTDESGALDSEDEVTVYDGNLVPGPHSITVQMEYRGQGFGVFSYLNGYSFDSRSSHSFTAPENGAIKLMSVGYERGNFSTEMRDRPAVSWQEVPLDAAGRPLPRTRGERGGASSNAKD